MKKLYKHLIFCSIWIASIVLMAVGFMLLTWYIDLPLGERDYGIVWYLIMGMVFGGFTLIIVVFEIWMKYYRESKSDYWERERIKEKKKRREEERRKRRERKASVEKYRKLEEERKEREKKNIPEKIVVSYPATPTSFSRIQKNESDNNSENHSM